LLVAKPPPDLWYLITTVDKRLTVLGLAGITCGF